jgi:hypothetical protein
LTKQSNTKDFQSYIDDTSKSVRSLLEHDETLADEFHYYQLRIKKSKKLRIALCITLLWVLVGAIAFLVLLKNESLRAMFKILT